MPAGPITIETGDALPATFTYGINVAGTPPYGYAITVFTNQSGIGAVISGGDLNIVNFNSTNMVAGTYSILARCVVTDANGDQDVDDDYYYITVNPPVTGLIGNLIQGTMLNSATGGQVVTHTGTTGGQSPYVLSAEWVGSQPDPTIDFNINVNDVEIVTTATPAGIYTGTLRVVVTDNLGQRNTQEYPVSLSVGVPVYQFTPATLNGQEIDQSSGGSSATSTISVVSGAVAPVQYSLHQLTSSDPNGATLDITGTSNETVGFSVAAGGLDLSESNVIRVRAIDAIGQESLIDLPLSYTLTGVLTLVEAISALGPGIDWDFQEASGDVVNYGGLGSTYDGIVIAPLSQGNTASPLPGAGSKYATFNAADFPGSVVLLDPAVSDFTVFDTWTAGTFIFAFRWDGTGAGGLEYWGGRRTTVRETIFLDVDPTDGYMQFSWDAASDFNMGGLLNHGGSDPNSGLQDQNWHVVMYTQRNSGDGPIAYYDGEPRQAGLLSIPDPDKWLAAFASSWISMGVGAYANAAADGSESGGFYGDMARFAMMPVAASEEQVYDITRLMFGTDFTSNNAYRIFMRYLYADLNGLQKALDAGSNYRMDSAGTIYSWEPTDINPAGDFAFSAGSNSGGGAVLTDSPSGVSNTALRLTSHWRFTAGASIDFATFWGASSGSFVVWFRRPNANAATTLVNTLATYGTTSDSTLELGFNIAFQTDLFVNDPDTLNIGWNSDATGHINSAGQAFNVASLLDDTNWHMLAVVADGVVAPDCYIDGTLLTGATVFENGTLLVEDWGETVYTPAGRPGTGNGGINRTYCDMWEWQSFPNVLLSAAQVSNAYGIGSGNTPLKDVGVLLNTA